jgi:hypothetical protein
VAFASQKGGHTSPKQDSIFEVYEKYKHLSDALEDPMWLEGASLPYKICSDLWKAIKSHVTEKDESCLTSFVKNRSSVSGSE